MAGVVINGLGAVGRAALIDMTRRSLVDSDRCPRVVHVNDPAFANAAVLIEHVINGAQDLETERMLRDRLKVSGRGIVIGGHSVSLSGHKRPADMRGVYENLNRTDGLDPVIVLDCSRFAAKDSVFAQAHLDVGAARLVISALAPEADINIVFGVNHELLEPRHRKIGAASCTTNCAAPVIFVLHKRFGVRSAHIDTIHAATTEQPIYDLPPPETGDAGFSRSVFNLVLGPTGAAKAVKVVIPDIEGAVHGAAIRGPWENGSVASIVATTKRVPTTDELREALKAEAEGKLRGVMRYLDRSIVSSDLLRSHCDVPSVVDGPSTYVTGDLIVVKAWYDNIRGYVANLVNLIEHVASRTA